MNGPFRMGVGNLPTAVTHCEETGRGKDVRLPTALMVECQLLGGLFSYGIQLFLGLIAVLTLLYKRLSCEFPKRSFEIWLLDISKQVIASVLIHLWNIGLSILFASLDSVNAADECVFYFMNFVMDTFAGVGIIWIFLKMVHLLALKYTPTFIAVEKQGYYGQPVPNVVWYLAQLGVYLLSVLVSKIILALVVFKLVDPLSAIGNFLFSFIKLNPNGELFLVMVIAPSFLSIIQYWIVDNILMSHGRGKQSYDAIADNEDNEELLYGKTSLKSSVVMSDYF